MGRRLNGKGKKNRRRARREQRRKRQRPAPKVSVTGCAKLDKIVEASALDLHETEIPRLGKEWYPVPTSQRNIVRYHRPFLSTEVQRVIYSRAWALERSTGGYVGINLIHGTPLRSIASIMLRDFRLPAYGGLLGKGVYFATALEKSLGFLRGEEGIIIRARVDLGRVYEAPGEMRDMTGDKLAAMGYDTAKGVAGTTRTWKDATLGRNEWCVYDISRIYVYRVELWRRHDG